MSDPDPAADGGRPARPREALETALRALNRREHSRHELAERLRTRGFDEGEIANVTAELIDAGALDDERFARAFSEDKRELAGWGPERVAAALAERGVAEELIERCCGGEARAELIERARILLGERGERLDDDRSRARALGFLTRRGYAYEIAYEAIRGLARAV